MSNRSERCGVCQSYISRKEPRCSGPCKAYIHLKCVDAKYKITLGDGGELTTPIWCEKCAAVISKHIGGSSASSGTGPCSSEPHRRSAGAAAQVLGDDSMDIADIHCGSNPSNFNDFMVAMQGCSTMLRNLNDAQTAIKDKMDAGVRISFSLDSIQLSIL